jgi:hypothetical protein
MQNLTHAAWVGKVQCQSANQPTTLLTLWKSALRVQHKVTVLYTDRWLVSLLQRHYISLKLGHFSAFNEKPYFNKTRKIYSLEYSKIQKAFFMPHHGQWHQQANQQKTNATMLSKTTVASMVTVATMWSKVIVPIMWSEDDLQYKDKCTQTQMDS